MGRELGLRLKKAREDAGFQTYTAAAAAVGVSYQMISDYEAGSSEPRPETLDRIVEAYRLRPEMGIELHEMRNREDAARWARTRMQKGRRGVPGGDARPGGFPDVDMDRARTAEPQPVGGRGRAPRPGGDRDSALAEADELQALVRAAMREELEPIKARLARLEAAQTGTPPGQEPARRAPVRMVSPAGFEPALPP